MGFGIVIPLLPTYVTTLHTSAGAVGFVMASFTAMQLLFNPVLGRLSDRHGRRPYILLGLLGSAASYVMFAFAQSIWTLLCSRMLAGLFNANVAVGQAYIADVTSEADRARGMGLVGAAFGLGFTLGPVIGGVSAGLGEHLLGITWSYRLPGLVAAGFSLAAFGWATFRLPESHPLDRRSDAPIFTNPLAVSRFRLARSRPLVMPLLCLFFLEVFAFANFESSFVLFGNARWGLTKVQAGLFLGYVGLISAAIQGGLIGRLARSFGDRNLLKTGLLLLAVGLGLLPLSARPTTALLLAMPIPMGIALINPTVPAILSRLAGSEERGAILGLSQGVAALGRISGQPYGTMAFQHGGPGLPFGSGSVLTLLAFLGSLVLLPAPPPR